MSIEVIADESEFISDEVTNHSVLGGQYTKKVSTNHVLVTAENLHETMEKLGKANLHSLMSVLVLAHSEAVQAFLQVKRLKQSDWEQDSFLDFNTMATPNVIADPHDVTAVQVNVSSDENDVVVDVQIRYFGEKRPKMIYTTRYVS